MEASLPARLGAGVQHAFLLPQLLCDPDGPGCLRGGNLGCLAAASSMLCCHSVWFFSEALLASSQRWVGLLSVPPVLPSLHGRQVKLQRIGRLATWLSEQQNQLSDAPGGKQESSKPELSSFVMHMFSD